MLDNILTIIAGLAGLGGLISILVNLLKSVGIIKDGQAEVWFQSINLLIFVAVSAVYFLQLEIDWTQVDDWLHLFAFFLTYIVQILGGKLTYDTVKGTPIIGFSYSKLKEE